jgi:hypothetical protein
VNLTVAQGSEILQDAVVPICGLPIQREGGELAPWCLTASDAASPPVRLMFTTGAAVTAKNSYGQDSAVRKDMLDAVNFLVPCQVIDASGAPQPASPMRRSSAYLPQPACVPLLGADEEMPAEGDFTGRLDPGMEDTRRWEEDRRRWKSRVLETTWRCRQGQRLEESVARRHSKEEDLDDDHLALLTDSRSGLLLTQRNEAKMLYGHGKLVNRLGEELYIGYSTGGQTRRFLGTEIQGPDVEAFLARG